VLLTNRLVLGDRCGLTECRVVLHVVVGVTFPSLFVCIVLSVCTTAVPTVHVLLRVFIVVSLSMWSLRIAFVRYVVCQFNMYLVTALGFEARKPRSIVLVITDLNTLT
jgi:hypothetical protein